MKTALFPGSFDPFTRGHEDLVRRALLLFDRIVIAVGVNAAKRTLYSAEKRAEAIKKLFAAELDIEVIIYSALTVDCCREAGAKFILRGLRNTNDFDFERPIAQMNHDLDSGIETIFMMTSPELSHISSTIVRDVISHGGDPVLFIPEIIAKELM